MLLYDSPVSGNCYKVRLLLAHLGLPYERRTVDVIDRSNRRELLGHLNPGLTVPTLVLDDGRPLGESAAILWYFGEGTRFVPEDAYERAQVLQWMFFEQYSHEPNIAVARAWLHVFDTEMTEERRTTLEAKQRLGYDALAVMEKHLKSNDYFVDGRYSIADIALYAYTHVADEGGFDLDGYPAILAWLERVSSQPGYIPITQSQ